MLPDSQRLDAGLARADGSTTATSPNRARVLRDHGPPDTAAPGDDPARTLHDHGPPGAAAPGDGLACGRPAQRATAALATVG